MEVKMVTKMVANRRQRVDIERDAPTRAVGFHNTNQHLSGQNKTDRNGHQQISSAVLSTAQRTCHGCKETYFGLIAFVRQRARPETLG